MLKLNIIGIKPIIVVVVVINTGLKRDKAVFFTASNTSIFCLFISSWNVSINTILLLTTTPAIAIIPRPAIATQNGVNVIVNITKTPAIAKKTILSVNNA